MISRHLPLFRKIPIRKRRPGLRRGEPTPQEKEQLRQFVYDRAGGRCELHLDARCIRGVLPWAGSVFERAHLVHLRARRRSGWHTDRLALGCFHCHIEIVHGRGAYIPATYEELKARAVA